MTTPITRAEIEELRRLDREATPGPWHKEMLELAPGGPMTLGVGADERAICIVDGIVESPVGNRNVALVSAARNALPRLLDAAEERDRLRKLLAECKSALGPVPGWPESSTARELRERIEAELLGPGHPAPDREPDEQQQGERDERLGPAIDRSDER